MLRKLLLVVRSRIGRVLNFWGSFRHCLLLGLILFKLLNLCILLNFGLFLTHLLRSLLLIIPMLLFLISSTWRLICIPLIFTSLLLIILVCGPRRLKSSSLLTSVSWDAGRFRLIFDHYPPIIPTRWGSSWQSWWYLSINRWWIIS